MVFTIKQDSSSGTTLLSTSIIKLNNVAPEVFFTKNSFTVDVYPRWSVNQAIEREGNFVHYSGSDDDKLNVELCLYGTNRFTNLATVKAMKNKVLYLDATDKDSNLTGTYYVSSNMTIVYDDIKSAIFVRMQWSKYNN